MFTSDRELLARELKLLDDAAFLALTRVAVTDAAVNGSTLSSASADFVAAGVDGGQLVNIAATPCEVLSVIDANTLTVSLLRGRTSDPSIPPPAGSDLAASVISFAPQRDAVGEELLQVINHLLELDEPIDADDVVSLHTMRQLETLGALQRIYDGAASVADEHHDRYLARADAHRRAFRAAWRDAAIEVDTDADGIGDRILHPGRLHLLRT